MHFVNIRKVDISDPEIRGAIVNASLLEDRTRVQGLDMLSMYEKDVLLLSVPAVKEVLAVWGCLYRSLLY